MTESWIVKFFDVAKLIASWSKDPDRKVGCIIVDEDMNQLAGGYNGFARGVNDSEVRLNDKELKLKLIVHAEAIANAARNGIKLKEGILFCTSHPCSQCAALIIQAGIREIYIIDREYSIRWRENHGIALILLEEAGVSLYRRIE